MSVSFWNRARAAPDRIAVIDPNDRAISAGALLAEVDRLSHAFSARGLVAGDTIAFALGNRVELLEVYLAALQCGLYVTPINTHLLHAEVAHILADSGTKLCFYETATADAARTACTDVGLGATDALCVDDPEYRALKAAHPATEPHARRLGAAFLYTSGTTGRPKGVRRALPIGTPEDALRAEYYLGLYGIAPGGDQVHLVCAPLHHGAALNWCVDHLHLGHTAVLRDKWTPEGMLAAVEAHRVTATMVVPTHFNRLLALPPDARAARDVSSLRHVIHTGAPCAPSVKQQMLAWWGPVIYEIYAASEGAATMVTPEQWLARPGTVGKAFPFARVRVLRPDGTDCAPGEPGEVYIRHAGSRFAYHNDRDKTERAWRDAFFTVGDIGYLDAEGYLFLCDRSSDVIVSGGVNIYPSEIEQVLGAHRAVADAAVIGTPDDEWGERVTALVALAPGVTASNELVAELIAHCRAHLAGFKCPRAIEVVASVPRGDNGKLARHALREPYWRGRSRAI